MNSTANIINQKDPIANRKKEFIPIGNRTKLRNFHTVDLLLKDYSDLIDERYRHWFAQRLYYLPLDLIHRYASEARQEGRDPMRLFAAKVNAEYKTYVHNER